MKGITNKIYCSLLFLFFLTHLSAQINLETRSRVFSPQALKDATEKLKVINKHAQFNVLLSVSVFHLENNTIGIREDEVMQATADLNTAVKNALIPGNAININAFEGFRIRSDQKAQTLLNGLSNAKNTVLINWNIGLQLEGYTANAKINSYQHITVLCGNNVASNVKESLTTYVNTIDPLDFNDATFKTNDVILEYLLDRLYIKMVPADVSYFNTKEKNLDLNEKAKCEDFPSYLTQPFSGIPWKCIPADGTFVPVKVTITELSSASSIQFKLTNTADFKLKSPTLDANSTLWISGTKKNSETAIVPYLNGVGSELGQINVIAYEKIVKEVAVVIIEEENDDVQVVPFEKKGLDPNTTVVTSGKNHFLDTRPVYYGDDEIRFDPTTGDSIIVAGPNGICETLAENTNIVPLDIDLNELERQLNRFFNPIMVEWRVHKTKYRKSINYDLNKDGYLDLSTYTKTTTGWQPNPSPEEDLISTLGSINGVTHHLFLVDQIPQSYGSMLLGRTTGNLQSALIFTRELENYVEKEYLEAQMITTCAHELGHAAFQLLHPLNFKDLYNLMGSRSITLDEAHLRKFQWDIIHGLQQP